MVYNGEECTAKIDMSDAKNLEVHGPNIKVMKNVTPEVTALGDYVTVMLMIENLGDRSAYIETHNHLPLSAA